MAGPIKESGGGNAVLVIGILSLLFAILLNPLGLMNKLTGKDQKKENDYSYLEENDELGGAGSSTGKAGATPSPTPGGTPDPNATPPPNADTNGDGIVDTAERDAWVNSLQDGRRGEDGALTVTSYGQANDSTPDTNTTEGRGAWNNQLSEGSVALSPSIVNTYHPERGASVYVNGTFVGYYEDHTPDSYNGQSYGATIDVYDPNNTLGPVLKTIGSGNYTITFGPGRTQVANP